MKANNRYIFIAVLGLGLILAACGSPTDSNATIPADTSAPSDVPAPSDSSEPSEVAVPTEEPSVDDSVVIIILRDSQFSSANVTVTVGTTIRWVHEGSFPHTVTSDDGLFDSGTLGNGGTFEFTFTEAGTYAYFCRFHGAADGVGMAAVVDVTE